MTISIVLYGRNDNYGYNLHKRAALSLNCMAQVLTDPSDEILFVDYNTPDDFPTFPEAIQDTLTKRTRRILRILRVRPRVHERFKSKTHLVALEPIARNIAIRRSSPSNRWILSTNTDMIFVPRRVNSLSKLAQALAPGFYHAPRMEIPEVLWESFDRQAPARTIATIREWGSTLHLNEIILGADFFIYDGPGDFQLLLRDDLFEYHGFHEGMLLGWHVDSNMAKRMHLKYGTVGDLGREVYGYHCDHTRQATPAHSNMRLQNDWRLFCHQVDGPDVPEQANTWGCADDAIEEVRLVADPASGYTQALRHSVGSPLIEPRAIRFTHETYNKIDYDPRHVVPFLADMFVAMPKSSNVAWYGAGREMLSRFANVWAGLDFTGKILVDRELIPQSDFPEAIGSAPSSDPLHAADVFVFDFGGLPGSSDDEGNKEISDKLLRQFLQVVREERRRFSASLPPRRIIALNAINNHFKSLVSGCVAAAATPCATHTRHGFVLPAKSKDDWLPLLHIGPAGVRASNHVINSDPRNLGVITYGPRKYLEAGFYRLSIKVELAPHELEYGRNEPCIAVEVRAGAEVLAVYLLRRAALRGPDHEFLFEVTRTAANAVHGVETRITLFSRVALSVRALTIETLPARSNKTDITVPRFSPPLALEIKDWLPYLSVGPLGCVEESGTIAQIGAAELVVFGPYWPLPAGYYEAIIGIERTEREDEAQSSKPTIKAEVMADDQQLVAANLCLDKLPLLATIPIHLPFEINGNSSEQRQIQTRVWSCGKERFRIRSLAVKALEQSRQRDLLPSLLVGEAGQRVSTGIRNVEGRRGVVAYSPTVRVKAGAYRMTLTVAAGSADQTEESKQFCAIVLVKYGSEVLNVTEITLESSQIEEQQLLFEVPTHTQPAAGLEFFLRVDNAANIALRTLSIEYTGTTVERVGAAVLSLRNWLPVLQINSGAHADEDAVVVTEGSKGCVVYGPDWALPARRYEMRALIIPHSQKDESAVVTGQVTAECGARVLAESSWILSRYKFADAAAPVEFRLPFSLGADLPVATRTIAMRIFTPGNVNFRILSLSVIAKSEALKSDWFPYLTVGACGIHLGAEIKSIKDEVGHIACTPPVAIVPGHYELLPDISIDGVESRHQGIVTLEIWSGSDLIAIETVKAGGNQLLEFDVDDEFSRKAIQLRVRAAVPSEFSIRGLVVEKVSDSIYPAWRKRFARTLREYRMGRVRAHLRNPKDFASFSKLLGLMAARIVRRIQGPMK